MYLLGGLDGDYNTPEDTWDKLIPVKLEQVSRLSDLTAFNISDLDERIDFMGFQEKEEKQENE